MRIVRGEAVAVIMRIEPPIALNSPVDNNIFDLKAFFLFSPMPQLTSDILEIERMSQ